MTKHSINPEDTDGGITAAAIEKETETPDYWRECAEGLHATVVKLQDAEEVLRARTEKAERERDEYRRSLERWRESAIRGRKERDEAKKFAGLWKEATREAIRHAERKDEALDAWRTRALDAEERERILIAERARRGEVCPDKDAHWRLDEALADLQAAEDRAEQAARVAARAEAIRDGNRETRPLDELMSEMGVSREALDGLADAEHRATRAEAQSAIRGRAVAIYQRRAREAEAERDWNLRSSRLAKEARIKANARAESAEARIKAVRDILNHHGNDGPVALDALQALNNPDGSPDQPCGRGPCALGNNHTGPCRR